jgi:hypothetical protein
MTNRIHLKTSRAIAIMFLEKYAGLGSYLKESANFQNKAKLMDEHYSKKKFVCPTI